MLRLLTDGAIDVPAGWDKEFDIKVIPINIHFGEKTYIQNVDMDLAAFYKEIGVNKNHPSALEGFPYFFRSGEQSGHRCRTLDSLDR